MRLRLAEMRERYGKTQDEIAAVAGVSPKTEWNWEQGKTFPNAAQLCILCDYFNTEPNTLLGWYDEHPDDRPSVTSNRDESALLDNYRAAAPEGRAAISQVARMACGQGQEAESGSSESVAV